MTDDFQAYYAASLFRVPTACHRHLRALFCDHRLAMYGEPERADEIVAALVTKVARLADPRAASLPVDLWRGNETTDAWLSRCYAASGFHTPSKRRTKCLLPL